MFTSSSYLYLNSSFCVGKAEGLEADFQNDEVCLVLSKSTNLWRELHLEVKFLQLLLEWQSERLRM